MSNTSHHGQTMHGRGRMGMTPFAASDDRKADKVTQTLLRLFRYLSDISFMS